MKPPVYRYLRGYSLDPGFSTRLDTAGINEVVYRVPFEPLEPGPVGEYIEVMDFDPASGMLVRAGRPRRRADRITARPGAERGQPAVPSAVRLRRGDEDDSPFRARARQEDRLVSAGVKPKGKANDVRTCAGRASTCSGCASTRTRIRDANAYYDPDKTALLFGYFAAADQRQGANYPGGLVFTCLSPDIVAHEMTHAILDSIHHRYMEDTNPGRRRVPRGLCRHRRAAAALHVRRAGRAPALREPAAGWIGYTVFGELATQFGEALEGNRGALRSMIGRWNEKDEWVPLEPSPSDYIDNVEAHDRGAVLVATVFDAFQRIYTHRTRDLLRIATSGTGVLPEGQHQPRSGAPPGRRGRRDRRAPAPHLHSRARLLPAERHLVRRLPARAHHGRSRHRAGGRERATASRSSKRSARAASFPRRVNTLSIESLLLESSGLHAEAAGHVPLHRRAAQAAHHGAGRDHGPARSLQAIPGGAGEAARAADGQGAALPGDGVGAVSQQAGSHVAARVGAVRQGLGQRPVPSRRQAGSTATSRASRSTRSARPFVPDAKAGRSSRCSSR